MTDDNECYRFMKVDPDEASDVVQLADDARIALLAVSIASQQQAGFKTLLDLRQTPCPDCGSPGFNSGWGYWQHVCGAEILSDGEPSAPCSEHHPKV